MGTSTSLLSSGLFDLSLGEFDMVSDRKLMLERRGFDLSMQERAGDTDYPKGLKDSVTQTRSMKHVLTTVGTLQLGTCLNIKPSPTINEF